MDTDVSKGATSLSLILLWAEIRRERARGLLQ